MPVIFFTQYSGKVLGTRCLHTSAYGLNQLIFSLYQYYLQSGKKGTSFFKNAKKSYPMFPFHEERIRWDEYGELIKPEDYMITEMNQAEEEKTKAVSRSYLGNFGTHETESPRMPAPYRDHPLELSLGSLLHHIGTYLLLA